MPSEKRDVKILQKTAMGSRQLGEVGGRQLGRNTLMHMAFIIVIRWPPLKLWHLKLWHLRPVFLDLYSLSPSPVSLFRSFLIIAPSPEI